MKNANSTLDDISTLDDNQMAQAQGGLVWFGIGMMYGGIAVFCKHNWPEQASRNMKEKAMDAAA